MVTARCWVCRCITARHNQAVQPDGQLGRSPAEVASDTRIYPDTVASWLAFRASMSHQHLIAVGGGDIPIIISEFGFDDAGFHSYRHYTGGASVSAWRECIPYWRSLGYLNDKTAAQFYGEQLAWAEAQAAIYPWLMGMTVFTVGSDPASRWALYDVLDTPVFDHFLAALDDQPDLADDVPTPPLTPLPPELIGCFLTPSGDRVNVRSAATADAPIVAVLERGEAVEALAVIHEAPGRMWFRTVAGYVAAWTVTLNDHCEALPDETPLTPDDMDTQPVIPLDHERLTLFLSQFRDTMTDFSDWVGDLLDGEFGSTPPKNDFSRGIFCAGTHRMLG